MKGLPTVQCFCSKIGAIADQRTQRDTVSVFCRDMSHCENVRAFFSRAVWICIFAQRFRHVFVIAISDRLYQFKIRESNIWFTHVHSGIADESFFVEGTVRFRT